MFGVVSVQTFQVTDYREYLDVEVLKLTWKFDSEVIELPTYTPLKTQDCTYDHMVQNFYPLGVDSVHKQ